MRDPLRDKLQDAGIQNENSQVPSMGQQAVMQSYEESAVPAPDTINAFDVINARIGEKQIQEAEFTLQKYKQGKAALEDRVIENQEWYRLRHWKVLREKHQEKKQAVEPASGWLFNSIANKHAVAMDNYPRPNIKPREQGDQAQAEMLSAIIPVVLEQCEFEETYSRIIDDKLISGTGVYGVFWDQKKLNGLGDIDIEAVDILSLFWEPGVQDIQRSRNMFYLTLRDNDLLEEEYPQFKNKLGGKSMTIAEYFHDDTIDTTQKSIVVDWYYKKAQNGRTVLHYCKFIMGQTTPIFATENDPNYLDRGWYDDGMYPFVFDPMFRVKGTPAGEGFIDRGKSVQEYIDRCDQGILKNMLFNVKPRHFIRNDGSVNEAEYADSESDFIHVDGNLGSDSVIPVHTNPFSEAYIVIRNNKIDELKETTGNRDVNTGGTTGGVTAASAIAAQQEAGAKLDRDLNKQSFRNYRKVINMVIERTRQFYDQARSFRIVGQSGAAKYVQFSNAGIVPQPQGMDFGVDLGYRLPLFDIEVTAEKASPYTRMGQNELALQFYSAGFFNPQMAAPAEACLSMMDFDHKDEVLAKISQNGLLQQQLMMAQQQAVQLASMVDPNLAASLRAQYGMPMPAGNPAPGKAAAQKQEALGGSEGNESRITAEARKRTAEASSPV